MRNSSGNGVQGIICILRTVQFAASIHTSMIDDMMDGYRVSPEHRLGCQLHSLVYWSYGGESSVICVAQSTIKLRVVVVNAHVFPEDLEKSRCRCRWSMTKTYCLLCAEHLQPLGVHRPRVA